MLLDQLMLPYIPPYCLLLCFGHVIDDGDVCDIAHTGETIDIESLSKKHYTLLRIYNYAVSQEQLNEVRLHALCSFPVSYTHLTLPTKRIV